MADKRRPDPNATIQIDQLDGLDHVLEDARPSGAPGRRTAPPPLPPSASIPTPPPTTSVAAPAPAPAPPAPMRAGKTVVMIGAFLLLLALAISAGLFVGRGVRGNAPAASTIVVSAQPPSAPAAAAPAASGSTEIMTLPPVDIK